MENDSQTVKLKFEKSYLAAVAIVLIIASCAVTVYFILPQKPSGYSEMYLLDAKNQAVDYPQVLVANQNSTFNQQVFVENHLVDTKIPDKSWNYQLQVKIVEDTTNFPVDAPADQTYDFNLKNGESWSSQVPISIKTLGSYSVVFELYADNVFTNNFCVLHIEVIAGSA
ncbi:MAG: DUF1616 domain-containing protein [Candidatus Bathyarchaeia archaeon]|jgi:uncharacterized membrane protein